ncbi:MAG: calcium/sodium antiporter [Bacteroidetes bacterium]|nr:calcium/sodium antiporter [Bacteroidota bacterium]
MLTYILFIIGFIFLILGANWLITGASSLGLRLGLSQLIIGLTIVALGTSLPELVINVFASINGSTDLAMGNVIGSNITNTLLVIGVAAIIFPIKVQQIINKRDIWFNLLAAIMVLLLANDFIFGRKHNVINQVDALILLAIMIYYLYVSFFKDKQAKSESSEDVKIIPLSRSIVFIVLGGVGLFVGGKWIVSGVSQLSTDLGASESALGLTLIAGATSLPELVTTIIAARKKNTDIAFGNAIGSNIFNIFLVLGCSALIKPIDFDLAMNVQIGMLVLFSFLLMLFIHTGKAKTTISRREGILLVFGYFCFLYYSIYVN